jgi:hypothetical protein
MKRKYKIIFLIIGSIFVVLIINFIPTLSLKTNGMQAFKGEFITVFYEKEEIAARDVFEIANSESKRIAEALGFNEPQDIKIYIYDNQRTFQIKKYGLISLLLNLDWYVGDNRKTNVLLTSPANPGKIHDYNNNVVVSIHEMVHAYNFLLNKNMPKWINEGIAGYLAKQNPREWEFKAYFIPTKEQMRTSNPITFSNMNGYPLSYTYIEYLCEMYGWNSVLTFAKNNNFIEAFGKNEKLIYDGWIEFLEINYK